MNETSTKATRAQVEIRCSQSALIEFKRIWYLDIRFPMDMEWDDNILKNAFYSSWRQCLNVPFGFLDIHADIEAIKDILCRFGTRLGRYDFSFLLKNSDKSVWLNIKTQLSCNPERLIPEFDSLGFTVNCKKAF